MKIRLSLIFITLSFFFLSCSNGISQKGEGSVTVDLSEFIQKVSSRAADNGQTATVTLRTGGDFVTSVTETVSTSGGSITLDNLPIGKTITISLETTIAHKYFEGFSEPLKIKDGNNQVTIRLARNGISTDYVLYDYYEIDSDQQGYRYYLSESSHTMPGTPALVNNDEYQNSFCFDNDGNLYALKEEDSELYLMSTRSDFIPSDTGRAPGSKLYMAMDREKDTLWLLADQELSLYGYKNISRQTTLENYPTDLRSAYVYSNYFYTDFESNYSPTAFTAYDGYLYLAGTQYDEPTEMWSLYITKTDVVSDVVDDGNNKDLHCHNTRKVSVQGINLTSYTNITDMLYQNGAVYILLNENNDNFWNDYEYYNRGVVVRYDFVSGTATSCGWTTDAINISGKKFYAFNNDSKPFFTSNPTGFSDADEKAAFMTNRANWVTFDDTVSSGPGNPRYPKLTAPYGSQANRAFYGPKKFIAVKPKKLVIADEGYAFYTDSNGAFCYKNVNRVVTVDLETFAISSTENVSVSFEEDSSSDLNSSGYTNVQGLNLNNCIYSASGSEYSSTGSGSDSSVKVSIPLGE